MSSPAKTDPIHYFGHEGQFGCFSNRCECYPFDVAGKNYKSVEAYFQSQKFHPNEKYMEEIRNAPNAKAAGKLGRSKTVPMRSDWDAVKEEIMKTGLTEKFTQNKKLGALLISTHGREVRFGKNRASKKDPFWGWDGGKGENKMGVLVTKIRSDLKEKAAKDGVDIEALLASEAKATSIHRVEYAKTGRAACKVCEKTIEKKELRIGKRVIIRHHESYIWFHWECYFTKNPTNSVEDWDGFGDISETDKAKLRSKVDTSVVVVTTSTTTQKAKEYTRDCLVEYATSNRSSCKWCKTNITKDTVRIAIQVKSFKMDGKIPHWHHVDCFFEKAEIPDLDCMDGLKSIRWEDQQKITAKFGGPANTTTPSTPPSSPKPKKKIGTPSSPKSPAKGKAKTKASEETPDSPKNAKRKRGDDSDDEEEDDQEDVEEDDDDEMVDEADSLQQLSAKFWALKDKLKEITSAADLKLLLEENNQDSSGGQAALLDKCAEGMFYGALPPCPSCKTGKLEKLKYNAYKCTGWISEWTRCAFNKDADELERLDEWKIPESLLDEDEFFEDFEFEKHDTKLVHSGRKKREKKERKPSDKPKKKAKTEIKKVVVKGQSGLHPESELCDTYHVYVEKGTPPVPYNVTLSMSDITTGTNSYYIIQLAERDEDKGPSTLSPYILYKKWGRVGSNIGSSSKVKCDKLKQCIKKFEDVYFDKSGNQWTERDKFTKKQGKYYPVEIDYGNEEALEDLRLKKGTNSKLSKPLQELIGLLFDVDLMAKTLVELEFDAEKTPLGMLGKGQIDKGYKILTEIQNLLDSAKDSQPDKLRDLNNQFFTIIPHMFKRRESADMMISTKKMVKDKVEMLDALSQIQIAYGLLKTDSGAEDPLEANYKKLNTGLEPVPSDSEELDIIADYIKETTDKKADYTLELMQAFYVERDGEAARFKKFKSTPNHMLLVHGSRLTNFVGILSKGLKIAPPDVPASGYLFGKGLYFADMFGKSAHYCRATEDNSTALLLLTEVALGNMYEVKSPTFMTAPPKGYNSTKALGKLSTTTTTSDAMPGLQFPKKVVQTTNAQMGHNEYIVYDEAQVYNRYLVQVKFHFK